MERCLIDYAYDFVSKNKGNSKFADIWAYVVKESGISEEEADKRISQFYTNLMLDGRFVTLGENVWDLRERQTFDKVHIDMRDVYSDDESDEDIDIEEKEEEDEYNSVFEEKKPEDSVDDSIDGNEAPKEEDDSEENL